LKIQRYNDSALICWKFFWWNRIAAVTCTIGRKDSALKN